jgi:hypothetical protein
VKSRTNLALAAVRTKAASERFAMKAYRSIPPRLVPASPKAPIAD